MKKSKHVFRKFMKFAYQAYKPYFFVILFQALVTSGLTIFNAYSLSIVISSLEQKGYNDALIIGGIIVIVNLIFNFLNKLVNRLVEVHEEALKGAINLKIAGKLMRLPFSYLEDPYYLDLKDRAKFAVENQNTISNFLQSVAGIFQSLLTLSGLITIMLMFDSILVIILVIAVGLNFLMIVLSLRTQLRFYQDLIPINRVYTYYLSTLLNDKKGKDFRMYSLGLLLRNKFAHYCDNTLDYFHHFVRRMALIGLAMQIIQYFQMAFVYSLVAVKTVINRLPVSTFSLYISTALSFTQAVTRMIDMGTNYLQMVNYLIPFIELIELPEETQIGKQIPFEGKIETIEFRNVSFSYPRSDDLILNNISFKVNAQEKISIVGLNGAGKTTLVKLLCRLYQPTAGEILVNGTPIRDFEFSSYIKQVSAVFQDFKLFAYSIKENILNSDGDEKVAYEVAAKVGLKAKIDSLPNGINTLYTKSYGEGGIELSGGEAQKVAIARALYSDSSLVILDEPTSALDPLAEAEIYQNFNDLVQDKTAIYISHRMSSSVFCDRILVIDGGVISDFDTHKNLMKKTDSLYYKLFMSQAKNYQHN